MNQSFPAHDAHVQLAVKNMLAGYIQQRMTLRQTLSALSTEVCALASVARGAVLSRIAFSEGYKYGKEAVTLADHALAECGGDIDAAKKHIKKQWFALLDRDDDAFDEMQPIARKAKHLLNERAGKKQKRSVLTVVDGVMYRDGVMLSREDSYHDWGHYILPTPRKAKPVKFYYHLLSC